MTRYASKTKVPIDQSRLEIERTLERFGASSFAYAAKPDSAAIMFEAGGRRIRITIGFPDNERERRQKWRALLLVIKAKLESVESQIETLVSAFYANIVMPDGRTVYESTREHVAVAYETGRVQALLPDYSTRGTW
jgi:hypothetical protein